MRQVLLCAALAAAPAMAGDLVARQGGDIIRLAEAECTSELVLNRIEPQLKAQFRAAVAVVGGQTYTACWRPAGRAAHLIYEDGDQGLVPVSELKPELSA